MVSHVQISERTLKQLISLLMDQEKVVVGIDLGTTTSCAFVPCHGKLENVVHQQNRNTIDSVIRSTPTGAYILNVDTAARAAQLKGKGCVYEAKRLIGKKYAEVEKEVKKNQWPFEVFEGDDGYAAIRVTLRYKGSDGKSVETKRELYPEEVGSYILRDMKERAEKLLECSINSCVIGCPVMFTDEQRKRTMKAAMLAGFTLDHIFLYPESTLAAIAYAKEYDIEATRSRIYLVYDFGGGAFNVSIVRRTGNEYKAVATEGDGNCGGKDIDARLMSVIREDLEDEDYEINENRLSKMKFACKQMKELLLTNSSYEMCCDFVRLVNDEDDYPAKRMTSAAVDAIAKPVINHTLYIVKRLLSKLPYTVDDIDYVFMVGGSSKLNGVRVSLEKEFGAEKVKCDTAYLCEAAIAKGAVLVALKRELQVKEETKPQIDLIVPEPIDDLMASSAIMQSVSSEVDPLPTPPIKPIMPPRPLNDTMPYSVVIKTADGEVELVPKGELVNHEFCKYVFPSSTSNSAVIMFGVRYGDALRSIGSISIPVNGSKDVRVLPLRVEARMEGSGAMNVCVKNEMDSSVTYTVTIKLSMNEEEKMEAIQQSIAMDENMKQAIKEELRTAIQAVYDMERYGGKLNDRAKRREWQAVVKQSQHCNSVEELKVLKKTIEKMRSEL